MLALFSFHCFLAPVVKKVDSTIHWITRLVSLILIRWIAIYPVDSVIQPLNNRALVDKWGKAKADVSSVSPWSDSLRRLALNARNINFRISLRWPIHIINPVDNKTNSNSLVFSNALMKVSVCIANIQLFQKRLLLWSMMHDPCFMARMQCIMGASLV